MAKLPATMLAYMTAELEDALRPLSHQQVEFINELIAAGYTADQPLAPYPFLFGGSPNSDFTRGKHAPSRHTWARLPKFDDDGNLTATPGWSHQPAFVHALTLAKRLARRRRARQMIDQIEAAYTMTAGAGPAIVANLIRMATDTTLADDGSPMARGTRDIDQITAAAKLLPILAELRQAAQDEQAADDEAADWWSALDDD